MDQSAPRRKIIMPKVAPTLLICVCLAATSVALPSQNHVIRSDTLDDQLRVLTGTPRGEATWRWKPVGVVSYSKLRGVENALKARNIHFFAYTRSLGPPGNQRSLTKSACPRSRWGAPGISSKPSRAPGGWLTRSASDGG